MVAIRTALGQPYTGRIYSRSRFLGTPSTHIPRASAEQAESKSASTRNIDTDAVREAVDILNDALASEKYDSAGVRTAFDNMAKNRMKCDDMSDLLGNGHEGKHWQLKYVLSGKGKKAPKGKQLGYAWPIPSVQYFYEDPSYYTNTVYLGHLGYFRFIGSYECNKNILDFTFEKLKLKVGPLEMILPISSSAKGRFVVFYADDGFFVARGMSGGTGIWKKINCEEALKLGAV